MKRDFYVLLCMLMVCCDADRTELPPIKVQNPQKLEATLYGRIMLEVTVTRPIISRMDSTHITIKNVSGMSINKLEAYIENCAQVAIDESCGGDILLTVDQSSPLADGAETTRKIGRFFDFTNVSSIYITMVQFDSSNIYPIAKKYSNSILTISRMTSSETLEFSGSAKVYLRPDGTFFCRSKVFQDDLSQSMPIKLEGTISKGDFVYASYMPKSLNSLPNTLFGNIAGKVISLKDSSDTLLERIELILR